jgi:hypothetical protein
MSGLQPSVNFLDVSLGIRPRLVYVAPLALVFLRGADELVLHGIRGDVGLGLKEFRGDVSAEICLVWTL